MNKEIIEEKVKKSLDRIRPYLQADGGDIQFVEVTDEMIVNVRLTGACHGCPHGMQTLKMGVERVVRQDVPEIVAVESV